LARTQISAHFQTGGFHARSRRRSHKLSDRRPKRKVKRAKGVQISAT
jgi:hypothetical protein